MNFIWLGLGICLFLITSFEIIKTTFSSNGSGRITNNVSKSIWHFFFVLSGKRGNSPLLEYAGPAILVSILFSWIMGLWGSFFLILLSDAGSVVNSSTKLNANGWEMLYYSGFILSTLGVGDYIASSDVWRVVTALMAFFGLAFITTGITYCMQVLSAVGLQNKLSLYIGSLGNSPGNILLNSWDGTDFSSLYSNLSSLSQMVMQHTVNHYSFPVIHYFHKSNPQLTIASAIVALDEAIQLVVQAVSSDEKGTKLKVRLLRSALDAYLEMVKKDFTSGVHPQETPPLPYLQQLEEQGISLKDPIQIRTAFEHELQERRKLLTTILEKYGWSWKDVYR